MTRVGLGAGRSPRVGDVARELAADGLSVTPGFVRPDEVRRLRGAAQRLDALGAMRPAGIGRTNGRVQRADVRSDRIYWLEPDVRGALRRWTQRLERLRLDINRRTFAGLYEWEGHTAIYGPGAGYARHLDRFRDHPGRVVSTILYLNDGWLPGHGGELRVWLADDTFVDIPPLGGTLVTFWSAELEHAVLPTNVDRWTVTGWFRTRD